MRIFVSSVRVGLEQERDSLRGLILALGHEPVLFEDFTAQPVPPREACLTAVRGCDAYLLLLGERYGEPFPGTDLSPTAEEHVAARVANIPRLVMRKTGVTPEPRQQELIEKVRSYSTGVFYKEFTDAVDLQAKVAAAIKELEATPGSLTWHPLIDPIDVAWRADWPQAHRGLDDGILLELHAVPSPPQAVPGRVLGASADRLASDLRAAGGIGSSASVPSGSDLTAAWAHVVPDRSGWQRHGETRDGAVAGVRLAATGQASAWSRLPSDRMGSLLDPADLTTRISELLSLTGAFLPPGASHLGLAVGLSPLLMVSEGPISRLGARTSATMASASRDRLAVPPDETASREALGRGARDAGEALARALLTDYRSSGPVHY